MLVRIVWITGAKSHELRRGGRRRSRSLSSPFTSSNDGQAISRPGRAVAVVAQSRTMLCKHSIATPVVAASPPESR